MANWTNESDRRLYLDADGKVVQEDDPNAATLLVGPGGELPEERARALGLLSEGPADEPAGPPAATEANAVEAPPENKSEDPPRRSGRSPA